LPSVVSSQNIENQIFQTATLKISEIPTNTELSDFGPNIVQDSLYFTAYNDNQSGRWIKKGKNQDFYKLYKAVTDKQGNVLNERFPVEPFITEFNEGPVSWCAKTGELFITANYVDQSLKSKRFEYQINRLRIVIAKQRNGKWVQVAEFPFNDPGYSVGHPAVTESGDTLIFSSERPGGYGETDLYYSVRKNGNWEIPVNLGSKINTSGKDEFASLTIQPNGRFLIFSSKGRFGDGDFDLYYTRFPSDFDEVGHFESPVNSVYADFAMTIANNADYGYLTSNRPGTGNDDIYKFTFRQRINQPRLFRTVYAFNRASRHPIPEVLMVDNHHKTYLTDHTGKADQLPCNQERCEITASSLGYQERTVILPECELDGKGNLADTIWMDIAVNRKITLQNIYFDFDKWDILPESARSLDRLVSLMRENPEMKVVLSSHTDDRGTELYNLKLSQSRAVASVNYVVSHGIDRSRITGIGYGKTQLIHRGKPGLVTTPEQNRENRRTEIFIPGFVRSESVPQRTGDFISGRSNVPAKENSTLPSATGNPKSGGASPNEHSTYYVILGSFQDMKSASALVKVLKSKGIKAEIIGDTRQFRVGVPSSDQHQAGKAKERFKAEYKSAWILTR
jgi:outer membrane protein OmpA-like peptidoglycan-associated protein